MTLTNGSDYNCRAFSHHRPYPEAWLVRRPTFTVPLQPLFHSLAILIFTTALAFAQAPDFYKNIGRVTWVVKDLDRPIEGWTRLGLTNVHRFDALAYHGKYRDQAISGMIHLATGQFGNLTVDLVQPPSTNDALSSFLARRGEGVFSIVHEVPSSELLAAEVKRMHNLGVEVLEQFEVVINNCHTAFTFFDTEPKGKYALGLAYRPSAVPTAPGSNRVSHIAFAVREMESVSAFWNQVGFPAVKLAHAAPREDGTYHGKPLLLPFEVGWDGHTRPGAEWIVPPQTPPNCYNDFLIAHGEGVHHLGVPVDDLDRAVAEYRKLGYQPLQTGAWGENGKKGSGRYAYMDTDSVGGVLVELIQAIK